MTDDREPVTFVKLLVKSARSLSMDSRRCGSASTSGPSYPNAVSGMRTNAGNSLNFFSDSIVAFAKRGDIFCLGGSSEMEPNAFAWRGSHSGCRRSR